MHKVIQNVSKKAYSTDDHEWDLKTLPQICGDFRKTLNDCSQLLNDNKKFGRGRGGFIYNVQWNLTIEPDVTRLRDRVAFHNVKVCSGFEFCCILFKDPFRSLQFSNPLKCKYYPFYIVFIKYQAPESTPTQARTKMLKMSMSRSKHIDKPIAFLLSPSSPDLNRDWLSLRIQLEPLSVTKLIDGLENSCSTWTMTLNIILIVSIAT